MHAGTNAITITASDAAGNMAVATLTITDTRKNWR